MAPDKNIKLNIDQTLLHDDDGENDYWKLAEERNIKEALSLNYTQRFRIMMQLMRFDSMLSRAKITHKKIP